MRSLQPRTRRRWFLAGTAGGETVMHLRLAIPPAPPDPPGVVITGAAPEMSSKPNRSGGGRDPLRGPRLDHTNHWDRTISAATCVPCSTRIRFDGLARARGHLIIRAALGFAVRPHSPGGR